LVGAVPLDDALDLAGASSRRSAIGLDRFLYTALIVDRQTLLFAAAVMVSVGVGRASRVAR
jgi:hypothetical protein